MFDTVNRLYVGRQKIAPGGKEYCRLNSLPWLFEGASQTLANGITFTVT